MQPTYDPDTRTISIPTGASPYMLAHERSHEAQQRARTLAWRAYELAGTWPYLSRPLRVWVEWEASRMALYVLALVGRCDRHARIEARRGIWSYIRACFWP